MSPEAPGEDAHVDVNMIYSENKTQFSHDNIFINLTNMFSLSNANNFHHKQTWSASRVKLVVSSVDVTLWSEKLI